MLLAGVSFISSAVMTVLATGIFAAAMPVIVPAWIRMLIKSSRGIENSCSESCSVEDEFNNLIEFSGDVAAFTGAGLK